MMNMLYRDEILDHWRYPRHFGKLKQPSGQSYLENTLCGDAIGWHIKIKNSLSGQKAKSKIIEAKFYGEGCALAIAGASCVAEMVQYTSLNDVRSLDQRRISRALHVNPGPARNKCLELGLESFQKALESL